MKQTILVQIRYEILFSYINSEMLIIFDKDILISASYLFVKLLQNY